MFNVFVLESVDITANDDEADNRDSYITQLRRVIHIICALIPFTKHMSKLYTHTRVSYEKKFCLRWISLLGGGACQRRRGWCRAKILHL